MQFPGRLPHTGDGCRQAGARRHPRAPGAPMHTHPFSLHVLAGMDEVAPEAWDSLVGVDNPFVEHAFLQALETSGSVGTPDTGWVPRHLLLRDGARLVGALPLYE